MQNGMEVEEEGLDAYEETLKRRGRAWILITIPLSVDIILASYL